MLAFILSRKWIVRPELWASQRFGEQLKILTFSRCRPSRLNFLCAATIVKKGWCRTPERARRRATTMVQKLYDDRSYILLNLRVSINVVANSFRHMAALLRASLRLSRFVIITVLFVTTFIDVWWGWQVITAHSTGLLLSSHALTTTVSIHLSTSWTSLFLMSR